MRKLYADKQKIHKIDQGAIINNCISEDYPNCKVWGCVITARCDLAHDGKVSTVHYLPVVDFDDWLKRDGNAILKKKLREELKSKLLNSINIVKGKADFIDHNLPVADILKAVKGSLNEKQYAEVEKNLRLYKSQDDTLDIKGHIKRETVRKVMTNLVKGDINNFYFIESWEKRDNVLPYKVILLKEIRRIRYDIASRFSRGFYETDVEEETLKNNDLAVSENKENIYWVEAQILSPFVEHILQAYTHNFSRIGVEDIEKDSIVNDIIDRHF